MYNPTQEETYWLLPMELLADEEVSIRRPMAETVLLS
jgi:hypothetical protein